jgi:hypothetical protein
MIKESINTIIALFFAFLLRGITYATLKVSFDNAPLFSLKFFYDMIIFLIYYLLFLFIVNKLRGKKSR